jgi:ABC-type cobalamin/Fe3+-siderophores transport system ATPase subunit
MNLSFYVKPWNFNFPDSDKLTVYLIGDNWNDFSYRTLYKIMLFDDKGIKHDLDHVKIANFGQTTTERINLPDEFEKLDDQFFSLGQSPEYYSKINALDANLKAQFLIAIRDIVHDEELQQRALTEPVTQISLLRFSSLVTVQEQYQRILNGGALLTKYYFSYVTQQTETKAGYELSFNVEPESNPPTNIHVLIGRNGVGKTHLLNNMVDTFIGKENSTGVFQKNTKEMLNGSKYFSRVVSVSFSAFDPFYPHSSQKHPNYSYIGLKREGSGLKETDELAKDFSNFFANSRGLVKTKLWKDTIKLLESDPNFADLSITQLIDSEKAKSKAISLFRQLSSGHAIVLLTVTKLVEQIEEKTLVLLDEPESHLHPPLLSALIRALSNLLINRNAVAIIATHSPVIVQEVPKSCVWKLWRSGLVAKAERFETETFGETIGKLTRDVFGLEINESGFYKILSSDVRNGLLYDDIIKKYDGQLGFEARLLLRSLLK